jgi:glycosidase
LSKSIAKLNQKRGFPADTRTKLQKKAELDKIVLRTSAMLEDLDPNNPDCHEKLLQALNAAPALDGWRTLCFHNGVSQFELQVHERSAQANISYFVQQTRKALQDSTASTVKKFRRLEKLESTDPNTQVMNIQDAEGKDLKKDYWFGHLRKAILQSGFPAIGGFETLIDRSIPDS